MKICTIIGARPQFIKAAPMSKAISERENLNEVIIHTGQHFDKNMSNIFFSEMNIPKPDYNLGVSSLSHGAMTGRQLEKIEDIILKEKPDWVLVYGDTNSTLAGALAAVKLHIPIIHIEAGIRSFNKKMPEEINRILTDNISTLLFVPTLTAQQNLKNEGINSSKIKLVGDVMYDASILFSKISEKRSKILSKLKLSKNKYILSTVHRPENTDKKENLLSIFKSLEKSDLTVVLPLHPRTRKMLVKYKINLNENIKIIDPIGYLDMIMLIKNAKIVATDSGGLQKEAYFFKIPCITFRNDTEWVELVKIGANFLVGTNTNKIIKLLNDFQFSFQNKDFYGDGNAANKIIDSVLEF